MMIFLQSVGIILLTVVSMEAFAWAFHKYVLHGPLWFLHKSHHFPPSNGWWEDNDWVSIGLGLLSAIGIILGDIYDSNFFWVGIGIAVYGTLYFIFHEIIVHQRIKFKYQFKNKYINRIIRGHKLHHKYSNLPNQKGESFGFLYVSKQYAQKRGIN